MDRRRDDLVAVTHPRQTEAPVFTSPVDAKAAELEMAALIWREHADGGTCSHCDTGGLCERLRIWRPVIINSGLTED